MMKELFTNKQKNYNMKIRELRIGNYVLFQNRIVKVQGLNISLDNTEEAIILDTDNCRAGCTMEHLKPIPLTDDILLRCGFKSAFCSDPQQDDAEIQWAHPYKKTENWTNMFSLYEHPLNRGFFDFHSYEDIINIEYLHQLQNLFLCLVGNELKIEL